LGGATDHTAAGQFDDPRSFIAIRVEPPQAEKKWNEKQIPLPPGARGVATGGEVNRQDMCAGLLTDYSAPQYSGGLAVGS